jgi:hypothetical protein
MAEESAGFNPLLPLIPLIKKERKKAPVVSLTASIY